MGAKKERMYVIPQKRNRKNPADIAYTQCYNMESQKLCTEIKKVNRYLPTPPAMERGRGTGKSGWEGAQSVLTVCAAGDSRGERGKT